MATTRIKAENFPDLADPVLYPRLPEYKLAALAAKAERRSFAAGEVLYEQGERDAPFFIIERGRVDLIDHKPGKDMWIAEADAGTFVGDIATFTGEPAMAECVASEPTDTIVFDRPGLRAMLAGSPEMGELVLGCLLARRAWHEGAGHGVLRLIAERSSRRAFEVRDLLERNLVPLRFHDVDLDPLRRQDPRLAGHHARGDAGPDPPRPRAAQPLRGPGRPRARAAGARSTGSGSTWSCSAAVRRASPPRSPAGSEGFRTFVAEAWGPGGQAGTSSRIENYLGFPSGISGAELTRAATLQARRFDAVLSSFHRAVELTDGPEGLVRVNLDDGQYVLARAVVVATGARWRELAVPDAERYPGVGALPRGHAGRRRALPRRGRAGGRRGQLGRPGGDPPRAARAQRAGGGARHGLSTHHVALPGRPHRALAPHRGADRDGGRRAARPRRARRPSPSATAPATSGACRSRAVFVMIGAEPCTEAVTGVLRVDAAGYLLCGPGAAACDGRLSWPLADRPPHMLETVRPSVFAAGDVRAGATNRVAGAGGRRSPGDPVRPRGPGRLAHAERNAAQNPKLTSVKYQRLEVSHITARAAKSVPPNTGRAQLGNEWFFSTSSFTARKP